MSRFGSKLLALLAGTALLYAAPACANPGLTTAVGDLKRDGIEDLVNIDAQGNINVVFCNPDGSFSITTYSPGDINSPSSVAVADVNGDGWPDVIVTDAADAGTGVHVLLNNGDGTLAAEVVYASGPIGTPGPQAITVTDINGDGIPDILTANGAGNTVSVLLGAGDGTFPSVLQYPTGMNPVAVAAADLNGDGWQDVVTADLGDNTVAVLLNNGDGTLAAPTEQAVGSGPDAVVLSDLSQDGHQDIVVADQDDDTVAVLINNGDGTFAAPVFYQTGSQPSWITAQVLSGSGLPDIVTDNYNDGSVSVLTNTGDGKFSAQQQVFPDYGSDNTVVMPVSSNSAPAVVSVDLQVSSVVVTTPPVTSGQPANNPPKPGVYSIQGTKSPVTSGHSGALDPLGLLLLAALFASRRLR